MTSEIKDQYLVPEEDFFERINFLLNKKDIVNLTYFEKQGKISSIKSKNMSLSGNNSGHFLSDSNNKVRLDKIVTLNGVPGPAYSIYESYMNACLTCEDLGQF